MTMTLFWLISIILSCCTQICLTNATSAVQGFTISGKIRMERLGTLKASNVKVILNSGQKVAFIRSDGYFSFPNIPAGTHILEVVAPGFFFSLVRVDVSARLNGQIQATLTETRRTLSEPLVLEPLREEIYFEKREPFSLMGLLKSPMGLMISFMAFAVFLLPKLMENIDPEEMRRMQEEMRNQPAPSLSNFLQ